MYAWVEPDGGGPADATAEKELAGYCGSQGSISWS
jgi:hypothetical protein